MASSVTPAVRRMETALKNIVGEHNLKKEQI